MNPPKLAGGPTHDLLPSPCTYPTRLPRLFSYPSDHTPPPPPLHATVPPSHLVTLDLPHLDDSGLRTDQLEPLRPEEERTSVRSVVALNVNTGRVRLREEHASVADRAQRLLEEVEVVNFL